MLNFMFISLFFFLIPSLFILINFFFMKKKNYNREKNSPFECGFDPISNAHTPFSISFFLISLMFLIFDIEISLLIPLTTLLTIPNYFISSSYSLFLIILLMSIYFEYLENMLEWK